MKEKFGKEYFHFEPFSKNDIINAIKKLPSIKASISNGIPVSEMKKFVNCYYEKLTNILKNCLKENRIPNLTKVIKISPVFKTIHNISKGNYGAISRLSNFAKLLLSLNFAMRPSFVRN